MTAHTTRQGRRTLMFALAGLSAMLLVAQLAAQKGNVPTFTGKGKVTEALNTDTGALLDIGSGVTMFFPVGLPIGRSRLVTFKRGKRAPAKAIAKGFKAIGPTLDFNGAFNTAGKPIVVTLKQKRAPSKAGYRLVLAMEVGTLCDDKNKRYKLKSGLCSGWELLDATYDRGSSQLVAKLNSTGGLRLQFGLAKEETAD